MARTDIYHYVENDPAYSPEWHWITEDIALGSYPLDGVLNELLESGITAIISMRMDEPDYDPSLFDESLALLVEDGKPYPFETLAYGLTFLHRVLTEGHKVYVHCFAGISRSAFFVASYLMLRDNIEFAEAVARVRSARDKSRPHPALWSDELIRQLRENKARILLGKDTAP